MAQGSTNQGVHVIALGCQPLPDVVQGKDQVLDLSTTTLQLRVGLVGGVRVAEHAKVQVGVLALADAAVVR
eukprot:4766909-Alexandrium_andersonii.AAC.1